MIYTLFLFYRRKRCHPKENFYKMGQQTSEKGKNLLQLVWKLTHAILVNTFIRHVQCRYKSIWCPIY